ncbi:superoxide dismutase, Ni [Terasakiella sp.]|uniref:superoxide dismutase, Ni n=1 Tax=Terasakiella sp. TaxID=2034861 RepID=UPI003AA8822D
MLHKVFSLMDRIVKFDEVKAHCDIPCKVYDPGTAQVAALSVVRMMDIMLETSEKENINPLQTQNTISRCIALKELEAAKVKDEVRIIWGDYIKQAQIEQHPNVHDVVHQIMMKASACKQGVDRKVGEELVELVNRFAEIFWDTKNIKTVRKKAPYPPEIPMIYPVW